MKVVREMIKAECKSYGDDGAHLNYELSGTTGEVVQEIICLSAAVLSQMPLENGQTTEGLIKAFGDMVLESIKKNKEQLDDGEGK